MSKPILAQYIYYTKHNPEPDFRSGYRDCKGLGTRAPQSTWEYAFATAIMIQLLTQTLTCKMGYFIFFGHGLTQSSKYDLVLLTHHPIKQEDKWRKMFPLVVEVPPMLVLLHILPPRQRIIHSFCLTGIHVRI